MWGASDPPGCSGGLRLEELEADGRQSPPPPVQSPLIIFRIKAAGNRDTQTTAPFSRQTEMHRPASASTLLLQIKEQAKKAQAQARLQLLPCQVPAVFILTRRFALSILHFMYMKLDSVHQYLISGGQSHNLFLCSVGHFLSSPSSIQLYEETTILESIPLLMDIFMSFPLWSCDKWSWQDILLYVFQ